MNTFANAVLNQEARTENIMKARVSSANACVDLFYKIGASRGQDIIPGFVAAYVENPDLAARITQWARDIRGGAGERQLFRDILLYLDSSNPELAIKLIEKIPEIGRFDDMLLNFTNLKVICAAYSMYFQALIAGDKLACKWAPRKGQMAYKLQKHWELTPRQYRKLITQNTEVVEQLMCANKWNEINFSHVPSLASARYKSAFYRHVPEKYEAYVEGLSTGETKVNAAAVYPYQVVSSLAARYYIPNLTKTEKDFIIAQWKALPNYLGSEAILPMVDVSGSMGCPVSGSKTETCMNVAVSLGIYCADKLEGAFKDLVLTFSGRPQLLQLKGNVVQKYEQLQRADWGMNTNVIAAFTKVLKTAVDNKVPDSEMPKILLILSDMQFDQCVEFDDSALESARRNYEAAGYTLPKIVFWNLNSRDNMPVKFDEVGTAMVSGFSPAILKAILSANLETFTPENVMLEAVMVDRYKI